MSARIITLIGLIVIVSIYVVYNTRPVEVRFLFWETKTSQALIALGALMG